MSFLKLLKKIPIDLAQAEMKHKTKGKQIGMSFIPNSENNKKALDVGCRDGFYTKILKDKGYQVKSIDIEPKMEGADTVNVNDPLPYQDNEFDVIWCSEVIEHLDDPAKSIKELKRVLKTGGILIITTPNSYFWILRLIYLTGKKPADTQQEGHKHFFNERAIRGVFPDSDIYGFFPYCIIKIRIKHLLGLLTPTFVVKHIKR